MEAFFSTLLKIGDEKEVKDTSECLKQALEEMREDTGCVFLI